MDAHARTVEANRLAHHVLVWNEGGRETAVLCHGFLDQAASWRWVAPHLVDAGLRVVAFDWRGHGDSEHIGRGGYYHFVDYVLDLHELLPQVASAPVHLVGHSMGGSACALFAATHGDALRTLTLIEGLGPPHEDRPAPEKVEHWVASVGRVRRRTPTALTDVGDAARRLRATHRDLGEALALELARAATRRGDDGTLRWTWDPLHRTTSPSVFRAETFLTYLGRIRVPTLIVTGENGYTTEDHARRVGAIPDAREVQLRGVGHMMHWLAPERLARALVEHMRPA
ncbi:MAG: alpha/beta fold hydrolase [Sandaracinaceae bacterium]